MTREELRALAVEAGLTLEPSSHEGGNDWIAEQEDTGQLARFAALVVARAADSLLALGLESDGATCDWPDLQAAITKLRDASLDSSSG